VRQCLQLSWRIHTIASDAALNYTKTY
jgi:hypothetical protein